MEKTLEVQNNAYKKYIDNHIANVLSSFNKYGKQLCDKLNIDHGRLANCILNHDKSKYSHEEFDGYRKYFYPTNEELAHNENEYRKEAFDNAWLHHLTNNSHHPEFWINKSEDGNGYECNQMDRYSIAEMLLDWAAMGITHNDNAYEYYINNKHNKPFHKNTLEIIDSCIEIFK